MNHILQPSNAGRERPGQVGYPAPKRARLAENAVDTTAATVDDILDRGASRPAGPHSAAQTVEAPTSFAGLIPSGCQDDRQPLRRLKTFEDIASARLRPQPGPQHSLPLPASQPDPMPCIAAIAAGWQAGLSGSLLASRQLAEGAEEAEGLPAEAEAPIDWSLKAGVRFTSAQPFTVWQEARTAPRREVLQAQRSLAAGCGAAALSLPQRLLAAAATWQFPQDPQPAVGGAAGRARAEALAPRRRDWQAALCSLYDALRCGACDAFYVASPALPPGTGKRPFAALFRASSLGGAPRVHALLTRSTPGLRSLLAQDGTGYAAPLMPGASAAALEGGRSLLVFEGSLRVHGLFELLLNRAFSLHDDGCDVPLLLAPAQFAHAALRGAALEAPGAARGAGPAAHQLLLRGPHLPPWVVDRVLGVLRVTQGKGVAMACDTRQETLALNWAAAGGGAGAGGGGGGGGGGGEEGGGGGAPDDYEARERGCLGAEEAARWRRAPAPGLRGAAVRELAVAGGLVAVTKLTSRVLPAAEAAAAAAGGP